LIVVALQLVFYSILLFGLSRQTQKQTFIP
jgi:hypothetical protein